LARRCRHFFGLQLSAHFFNLAEYPQQIAAENLVDVFRAVTAVEQRLRDLGQVCGRVDAFRRGAADSVKIRAQANVICKEGSVKILFVTLSS
jgi:hypothetical protein